MSRTALILGPGALCGAYGAGVASVLGRHIKFDRIYGCSVGVFAATFLVTEQFDTMLDVWRNHVYGRLLINFRNILCGRNILDLEYLVGLFQREPFLLDIDKLSEERERLVYVLTNVETENAEYFCPSGENVFDSMTASSAMPHMHPKVKINDDYYYDGAISDPYPLQKALDDGHKKVIVISNFSPDYSQKPVTRLSGLAVRVSEKSVEGLRLAEARSKIDHNIVLLRPSLQIVKGVVDTSKERINETIDLGIQEAENLLRKL